MAERRVAVVDAPTPSRPYWRWGSFPQCSPGHVSGHMDRRFAYWLYDRDGRLLYVGCTINLWRRLQQHMERKPWWPEVHSAEWADLDWFEAWDAEQDQIRTDPGIYNVTQVEAGRRAFISRAAKVQPCPA